MNDTPKRRRWLMPLLFASLAANLLIAGIVLGWAIADGGPRDRGDVRAARGLVGEPFIRALPAAERRRLVRDIIAETPRIEESRDRLRARFDAFLTALRAQPYDPSAVATLLAEQRQVVVRRQEIGQEFLLRRLETMTDEERDDYASRLEEGFAGLRRR